MEPEGLDNIGLKYRTDKASFHHDYLKKYQRQLHFNRNDPIKILEIGVLKGASVRTWSDWFYSSEVIGVDKNPECKTVEEGRIKIEIGDQTDKHFLNYLIDKYKEFNFIIDDGSHLPNDVIKTFEHLFPSVTSNGIYCVEDTCTSYWAEFDGGILQSHTPVEYFKRLIDEVNFYGLYAPEPYSPTVRRDSVLIDYEKKRNHKYLGMHVNSITFMNSMIMIHKR